MVSVSISLKARVSVSVSVGLVSLRGLGCGWVVVSFRVSVIINNKSKRYGEHWEFISN